MSEWSKETEKTLRGQHKKARHAEYCWKCDVPWPCPTIAALDEIKRLERALGEAEMSSDCIGMIRDALHKRFGDEVDAAFFDDVVSNALILSRREAERDAQAQRERADRLEAERDELQADALRSSPPYYRHWEQAEQRIATLEKVLRSLVAKVNLIGASAEMMSVMTAASVHGMPYRGETWTPELTAAEAALAAQEVKP